MLDVPAAILKNSLPFDGIWEKIPGAIIENGCKYKMIHKISPILSLSYPKSEHIQTHPNVSEVVLMHSNASEHVQMCP